MNICIPKERRSYEFRVGLTPGGVQLLTQQGHVCYIEHDAGQEAGFSDQDYQKTGGKIVYSPQEVFGRADLLLKIARPTLEEIEWLNPRAVVAGLLHLSSAKNDEIQRLHEKEASTLAYEHIQLPDGSYPVRTPLSQIGGRLSAQIGARLLQNTSGGKGIILGGIPGIPQARVVVIGAGIVGTFATRGFVDFGAQVTVLDTDLNALQHLQEYSPGITTLLSNPVNIAYVLKHADLVIGAVYVSGDRPPVVVTREMIRSMRSRSVIMDISIDEGGCIETSRLTTHETPTFIEEGVIHYCVPNIPSIVARSATFAFLNTAFDYIFKIATVGLDQAIKEYPALQSGVRIFHGEQLESREAHGQNERVLAFLEDDR